MTASDLAPAAGRRLPDGFQVVIRDDVGWHHTEVAEERVLLGGSPLRATRLTRRAHQLLYSGVLTVSDPATADLARRLLDGNVADPVSGPVATATELTVVIPVRDRPAQLERCLLALAGLEVIVVDDASRDRGAVRAVVERHGAILVPLSENVGPAGARNAGLARVTTPYVAFVDSDVTVPARTLRTLAGHFADPLVALVGPLVRGRTTSVAPRWFERYDAAASSLALGTRACSVAVGAAVCWLPSACLVARTEAVRPTGFADDLRVGEDVDLVWRLLAAGWRVRYQPEQVALHDVRSSIGGWLGRKVAYGTGGAPLAERHGDAVAVARLSPLMAVAAGGVLLRRPWPVAGAVALTAWAGRSVYRSLPPVERRPLVAAGLAARGLGWSVRQESALLLRHWWPVAAATCLVSATARRAVATALLADAIMAVSVDRPIPQRDQPVGPLDVLLGRRLDDLAYGSGLWLGALRHRTARPLAVVLRTSPRK